MVRVIMSCVTSVSVRMSRVTPWRSLCSHSPRGETYHPCLSVFTHVCPAHFLDGDFRNTGLTRQLPSTFPPNPALTCGGCPLGSPRAEAGTTRTLAGEVGGQRGHQERGRQMELRAPESLGHMASHLPHSPHPQAGTP